MIRKSNKEFILITGVAGFIGSHVATRFLDEGYSVIGVDDLSSGRIDNIPSGVDFIEKDVAAVDAMVSMPKGCQKILHIAGQSSGEVSFDNPVLDLAKNTTSTLNLIHYAIDNQIERMVYASSMSVYGSVNDLPVKENHVCHPLSCYGVGKYASEQYLGIYQSKLPSVILRMFNVYGPGQDLLNLRQGMVSIYLAQAFSAGQIKVKGGIDRFRDFIFIDDVVEVWFRAAIHKAALGKTLNVGTGVKTKVEDLLNALCLLIPGSSYFISDATPGDQSGIFADISRLKNCLEFTSFTSLDSGLNKFVDWASQPEISC